MSSIRTGAALLGLVLLGACAKNQAPELLPIDAQVAFVGSRFELRLSATDPEGDRITYDYECPGLDIADRARLVKMGAEAIFSWTPIASDVGEHGFDFMASDGRSTDIESVTIVVRASASQDSAPVFRKPLGEGTTLDLAQSKCLELEVVVEDSDSLNVEVRQEPPIAGSSLRMDGHSGVFTWCPSDAQANQQRFTLHLVADDHDNPVVHKYYTILLRSALPTNCPGQPPTIQHTPPLDQTTADDIPLIATVTDDKGLKGTPVVYHTTTPPADPAKLDFGSLSQLSMNPSTPGSTTFQAKLPNPTVGLPAGGSRVIYYVIVAEDDDDAAGNCDHRTQLPDGAVFKLTVTRPTAGACVDSGQCAPGQMCDGKTCIADTCTPVDSNADGFYWEQASCPAKHFCPVRGPATAPSHCAETCSTDADCKLAGYRCKVFDTKKGCGLEGSKNIGTGCSQFTECKGKAMCLPWPGGYCSISDCDSAGAFSGPCPSGSVCVPMADPRFKTTGLHWLCLKLCTASFGQCRTSQNYSCKTVIDDMDTEQQVCIQ